MTSYTAFFVGICANSQWKKGERYICEALRSSVCDFIGDVKSQNVFIFLEQQICFVSCRNYLMKNKTNTETVNQLFVFSPPKKPKKKNIYVDTIALLSAKMLLSSFKLK